MDKKDEIRGMLLHGESYRKIHDELHVSFSTIKQVKDELDFDTFLDTGDNCCYIPRETLLQLIDFVKNRRYKNATIRNQQQLICSLLMRCL